VRPLAALALVLVVAAALWYVVAPPRDPPAYRDRASEATQTLHSQVLTAALWAQMLADDRTLEPTAAVGLDDNERQAEKAASKFAAYEPPRGTDGVRERFTTLANAVTDELGRLRIAAQRREWKEVERARPRLERLAAQLEEFRRTLRG